MPKGPDWICTPFRITGDKLDKEGNPRTEDIELWHRDPVECIRELFGNPAFETNLYYEPYKVYRDEGCMNREYSDLWTGDWWWNLQASN